MLTLGISTIILAILTALFVRWESRNRPDLVVVVLLGLLILDVSLFADSAAASQGGIFELSLGGQGLRLTQAALLVALLCRLTVRGVPKRWVASMPLWLALSCWVLTAGVAGYLAGNAPNLVVRHLTLLPIIASGMLVVGGTPARLFLEQRAFRWLLWSASMLAILLLLSDTAGVTVTLPSFPLIPLLGLGGYGADAGAIFSSLGLMGIAVGAFSPRGGWTRISWLTPSVALVLSLFASSQRAGRLGLFVGVVILLVAALSPLGRRRLDVSRARVLLAGLLVAGLVAAASLLVATVNPWDQQQNRTSASSEFDNPFAATSRQGSIQSRYNQWAVARDQISDSAVIGHGLGHTARHYEVGAREVVESDLFHNVLIDLWIRTGLVGMLLAMAAVLALSLEALQTWRRSKDDQIAALALAGTAALGALLAKGMVESVFEKDRLAIMIAVALGIMASATLATPLVVAEAPVRLLRFRLIPSDAPVEKVT